MTFECLMSQQEREREAYRKLEQQTRLDPLPCTHSSYRYKDFPYMNHLHIFCDVLNGECPFIELGHHGGIMDRHYIKDSRKSKNCLFFNYKKVEW